MFTAVDNGLFVVCECVPVLLLRLATSSTGILQEEHSAPDLVVCEKRKVSCGKKRVYERQRHHWMILDASARETRDTWNRWKYWSFSFYSRRFPNRMQWFDYNWVCVSGSYAETGACTGHILIWRSLGRCHKISVYKVPAKVTTYQESCRIPWVQVMWRYLIPPIPETDGYLASIRGLALSSGHRAELAELAELAKAW